MKNLIFIYASSLLLISCGNNNGTGVNGSVKDSASKTFSGPNSRDLILQKIAVYEKQAKAPDQLAANRTLAQNLINAYNEYASSYPKDTIAAMYSFKAAEVATNSYINDQAIVLIDKCLKEYPMHKQKLTLLFLKAMIYDDRLNDDARAKMVYEQIVKEYPGTPAETQAKDAMKLLGKSDADLIKEFNAKNKGGV